jgi:hypothetical protein
MLCHAQGRDEKHYWEALLRDAEDNFVRLVVFGCVAHGMGAGKSCFGSAF